MNDSRPRKLTPKVDKQITEDWLRELPGLGWYRPRWLMRRVGPMLIGLCLDRDSGNNCYIPRFHVFFLGREWSGDKPALTLCTDLASDNGTQENVTVRWHESTYVDAVARMRDLALLPLEGPVTLRQVVGAYETYMETPRGKLQYTILGQDIVLLLTWCGLFSTAKQWIDRITGWQLNERAYQHVGGSRQAFIERMQRSIEHPKEIQEAIDRQIKLFDVENLPYSELKIIE